LLHAAKRIALDAGNTRDKPRFDLKNARMMSPRCSV
jgi:hypothetical protein